MFLTKFDTRWGQGSLIWNEQGITELKLPVNENHFNEAHPELEIRPEPFDALRQLRYYFEKKLEVFALPLNFHGTDFQNKVWDGLQQIPYGETWSYQRLAELLGHPRSARAVGNANHHNPIPIIIPCHRVIRSNGELGGYGGGVSFKEDLLRLESEGKINFRR